MLSQPLRFTNSGASSDVNFYRHQEMDCVGGGVFEKKGVEQRVGFMEEFEFGFEMDMTGVDDFSVDDLLDFPPETDEFETEIVVSGGGGVEEVEPCVGVKLEDVGGEGGCCGFSPSEISVPAADVAELEWLSRFVEDSFSEFSLTYSGESPREKTKVGSETVARLFPRPLTKPRAKRSRSSGKSWTLSDTTTSSSSSGSTSSPLILNSALKLPPAKRQSRRLDTSASQSARRCSHCGAQKTPQWRTGPGGAKTLCNACGVRFKSGRLCPEYRPACSPTFSSELHSNQHRKVVEMRMKKIERRLDQGNDGR